MYIPKIMKKQMSKIFYDKTISVIDEEIIFDTEGGVVSKANNVLETFKGNVSFSNCKKIQEEYGLDYNIDISITTNYRNLKHNNYIKYNDVVYSVVDILPSDSHVLIVASKWQM